MTTIDITGTGLRSSGRISSPVKLKRNAAALPVTPWPTVTGASVADAVVAALAAQLVALERLDAPVSSRLASSDYAPPPSGSQIAGDVLAAQVESGASVAESLRLANAVLGGKTVGAGSDTERFRSLADDKDRVVSTVSRNGLRTAVQLDLSDT